MSRVKLLAFVLVCVLPITVAHPVAAQEVRVGIDRAFPDVNQLDGSEGYGFGFRWLFWDAIGLGVDFDRFTGSNRFRGNICQPPGNGEDECVNDEIDFDSEMDLLSMYLVMDIARSGGWTGRIMIGRTAGTARGSGVGVETGLESNPPPADRGAPALAFRRGADGSFMGLELLRSIPGPLPVHVQGGIRYHRLDGNGCVSGELSPFCGNMNVFEIQLGLVAQWPTGWLRGEG